MFLQRINMFYMGLNDINMPRTTMFNALRGLCSCFMSSKPQNDIKNVFWKPKQFWSVLIAFELEHTSRSCLNWRTLRRTPGWQVLSLMTLAFAMNWWWLARRLRAQAPPGQRLLLLWWQGAAKRQRERVPMGWRRCTPHACLWFIRMTCLLMWAETNSPWKWFCDAASQQWTRMWARCPRRNPGCCAQRTLPTLWTSGAPSRGLMAG